MEYKDADRILSEQFAKMRLEKPSRPLTLHTPARPLHRRIIVAASCAAAAVVAAALVLTLPGRRHSGEMVCYIDGTRITDRQAVAEYTRRTLDMVNSSLKNSTGEILSNTASRPAMERVGEMLDALAREAENE